MTTAKPPASYIVDLSKITLIYDADDNEDRSATIEQPLTDVFDVGTVILDDRSENEGDDAEILHAIVELPDELVTDLLSKFLYRMNLYPGDEDARRWAVGSFVKYMKTQR